MTDKNDDWNFEIEKKSEPKKKRKKIEEPILNRTKNKNDINLSLNSSRTRKSRTQLAKEMGERSIKDREIIEAATHWKRGMAFLIDFAIFVIVMAIGQGVSLFYSGFGKSLESFIGPEITNALPFEVGGLAIGLIIHFLFFTIPSASSQKSLGKKILKLKVLGTLKSRTPLGAIVIREFFGKPLSILSLFGILLIPMNKKRRGLHDYIAGTFVINDL